MKNCVYILLCCNNRYYIGSTLDLHSRMDTHFKGRVKATRNLRPLKLVFTQECSNLKQARQMEYWLKRQKDCNLIKEIINFGKIKKQFHD